MQRAARAPAMPELDVSGCTTAADHALPSMSMARAWMTVIPAAQEWVCAFYAARGAMSLRSEPGRVTTETPLGRAGCSRRILREMQRVIEELH